MQTTSLEFKPVEETRLCPQCGSPLAADAPQGICPKCLLATGIASQSGIGPEGATTEALQRGAFEPPAIEELARLFPQLEILELVGCGGMGAVYKARQRQLDRVVALKILPPSTSREAAFNERFAREARAMAKLFHPHIVLIFDFGQAEGVPYFIMEFVDGVNLRQATRAGRLLPEQALAIVPQICEAVQYAHDAGVVHRDIKPENILLDRGGQVKIADFGLAKLLGQAPSAVSLTGSRQAVGTPHYMAPEQIENPQVVDHRADIYALGVVFYEMLTGELPIGRFAPPSAKGNVDARLDDVVHKTLEKEPERRYQHASEIKTDVDGINAPLPDSYVFRWAEWAAEWRRWAIRTLKIVLLGVYLFCLWCFFSVGGTEGETRVQGGADYVHTVGSPEPWFEIEDRPPDGFSSKLRLLSRAWFSLAGGLLSYYVYWRIRRAELGGRRRILLYAGPVLNTVFWLFVGFVAIASGTSAEAHKLFMQLPLGLSIF